MNLFKNRIKNCFWILILLIVLYIIQHLLNFIVYDNSGPSKYLVRFVSDFGIEDDIIRFILWYIISIAITILCLKLIIKKPFREMGFNFENYRKSNKYIIFFLVVYPILYVVACYIIYITLGVNTLIDGLEHKPIHKVVIDVLSYGLLPGIGEEPLYRVFVIQFLMLTIFKDKELTDKNTRMCIIILSALCFSYGHIYIVSWNPLNVIYNPIQLFTAFVLGIYYAITYIRTKSIYAAIVCHNYSDFVYRLVSYLILN